MGRSPYLHIVDDPVWSGASADDVIAALAGDEELSVVFLADHVTMRDRGPRQQRPPLRPPGARTAMIEFTQGGDTVALEAAAAARTDRRSVLVRITPAGLDWLDSFRAPTQRAMSALFQGFTPAELAELRHLCLRLVENQQRIEQYLTMTGEPDGSPA